MFIGLRRSGYIELDPILSLGLIELFGPATMVFRGFDRVTAISSEETTDERVTVRFE